MGHSNYKIQPPVNIREDLGAVLGRATGDLGQLCGDVRWDSSLATPAWVRAYAINPWALYKPIRENSWRMVVRTLNLHSLGFGDLPSANTVQGLINLYGDTELLGGEPANGWHYLPPRGAAYNEPYRVFDFCRVQLVNNEMTLITNADGYDARASNPFGELQTPLTVAKSGGYIWAQQKRYLPAEDVPTSDTEIAITDFNNIISQIVGPAANNIMKYYGILMVPINPQTGAWYDSYSAKMLCTLDSTDAIDYGMVARGHEQMEVKAYQLVSGGSFEALGYKVYPFLTNTLFSNDRLYTIAYSERNSSTKLNGRILYPIPGVTPTIINIYDYQIVVSVFATKAGRLLDTDVYYTVKNNSASAVDLKFYLQWRTDSVHPSTARRAGEVIYEWQNNTLIYKDDTHTGGAPASTAMATFLSPGSIGANVEKRMPGEAPMTATLTLPSADANVLIIGCYYNGAWQYGERAVIVPVVPDLDDNGGGGTVTPGESL